MADWVWELRGLIDVGRCVALREKMYKVHEGGELRKI